VSLEAVDVPRVAAPRAWATPAAHYKIALKDPWFKLVLKLLDAFNFATTEFWRSRGVTAGLLSLTTGSISCPAGLGSDANPVEVTIAGVKTYLTDSQQFALEFACRLTPRGAYSVMPSFRGDVNDDRHLAQFFHSEAELRCRLDEVLATIEEYLIHLARFFVEHFRGDVQAITGTTEHLERLALGGLFQRITFADAAAAVADVPGAIVSTGTGRALTRRGESAVMERLGEFIWVTHHDELAVPFFQASDIGADARRIAQNADLLFGIGEIVGAGERHETAADVLSALERHQVSEEVQRSYDWYVEMRRIAPLKTSGFGLGIERFLLWLLNHDDIRDVQLFARENGRAILP